MFPSSTKKPSPKSSALPLALVAIICAALGAAAATWITLTFAQPRVTASPAAPQAAPVDTSGLEAQITAANNRIKKLATVQANTLTRISDVEKDQLRTRTAERAFANAQRDMRLRLESLGSDFRRMPDTAFSEPGLSQP